MGADRLNAVSAGALWCFACIALSLTGCQRESEVLEAPTVVSKPADDGALNVVLITLDTTRADALGSLRTATSHHTQSRSARRGGNPISAVREFRSEYPAIACDAVHRQIPIRPRCAIERRLRALR